MSTGQLVLDYINAIKWPVVAGAAIFYFRLPLSKILMRIAEAKKVTISIAGIGQASWDLGVAGFDQSIAQLQRQSVVGQVGIATQTEPNRAASNQSTRETLQERRTTPRGRLLGGPDSLKRGRSSRRPTGATDGQAIPEMEEAWHEVQAALQRVAAFRKVEAAQDMTPVQIVRAARLPEALIEAMGQLASLRNLAMHQAYVPSEQELTEWLTRARLLETLIDQYGAGGVHEHDVV